MLGIHNFEKKKEKKRLDRYIRYNSLQPLQIRAVPDCATVD